jgi:pimeloyl-ACP methyl ester carboxylesterase
VEIAMVDEVGHYPHVEAPDKVAQVVFAFLKTVGVTRN